MTSSNSSQTAKEILPPDSCGKKRTHREVFFDVRPDSPECPKDKSAASGVETQKSKRQRGLAKKESDSGNEASPPDKLDPSPEPNQTESNPKTSQKRGRPCKQENGHSKKPPKKATDQPKKAKNIPIKKIVKDEEVSVEIIDLAQAGQASAEDQEKNNK